MSQTDILVWNDQKTQQFVEVLVSISDPTLMRNFLRDVMTEKEIIEMSARLEAAKMLTEGKTYNDIITRTKLSSRTVARISEWLQNGCNGYEAVLNTIHHDHMPPARAE